MSVFPANLDQLNRLSLSAKNAIVCLFEDTEHEQNHRGGDRVFANADTLRLVFFHEVVSARSSRMNGPDLKLI